MGSLLPQKSIIFSNFLKQFVFVKGQLILFYLSGQNNLAIILTLRLTIQEKDLFFIFSVHHGTHGAIPTISTRGADSSKPSHRIWKLPYLTKPISTTKPNV